MTGGVNKLFPFRNVTPLDRQTVVRMNKDTLYTVALVDTSKGAAITVPEMPADRYFSVQLVDNDHYCPGVIYTSGTHKLPEDTKYLSIIICKSTSVNLFYFNNIPEMVCNSKTTTYWRWILISIYKTICVINPH